MTKKTICSAKVNAFVANNKMAKAIESYNTANNETITGGNEVVVAKVTLGFNKQKGDSPKDTKKTDFLHPTGKPFVCFMKQASHDKVVIVGVESGKAEVVNKKELSVKHSGMKSFKVKGVTYKVQDTVNGFPRFVAQLTSAPRKNKIALNGPEFSQAIAEQEAEDLW